MNAKDLDRELLMALRDLRKACEYVSPIAGAVATEAKVSHIRQAGKFMAACRKADAVLAKVSV